MPEERKLAAIMFTDIAGYTALMGKDEDKAFEILKKNHNLHQALINKYTGTLIKELGDGTLISFPLASDAVRCAIEIQKEAKEQNIPLKIGIHEGEMVMAGEDVLGDGVNIASRLQEASKEGCITISGKVYSDIKNKAGIKTKYIGEKKLKNVDDPVKMYEVLCEEEVKSPEEDKVVKSKSRILYYIIAGIIVVLVAVVIWQILPKGEKDEVVEETVTVDVDKSIAVLPFDDLSAEGNNQYFCDGVMEGILNHLSKIKDLRVVSKTSVEQYRENLPPATQIGEELNVTYLLEASVFKSEDKIRVTVQLIEAAKDEHIWSEQYDRELEDIFEVMSDISQEVASEVKVVIAPDIKERIESIPTKNIEAYDLYLRGREYQTKYALNGNKSDLISAINLYQQSIVIDSTFAPAFSSLGMAIFSQTAAADYFEDYYGDTLLYYANKAISLNPNLADGYLLKGQYFYFTGELDKVFDQLEKAIELNPNSGQAYGQLGWSYCWGGQFVESIKSFKKALILSKGSPDYAQYLLYIGMMYRDICDYNRYEATAKELLNYDPLRAYRVLAKMTYLTGRLDEYQNYTDKICAIDSGRSCYFELQRSYLLKRDFHEALKYHLEWEKVRDNEDNGRKGYLLYNLNRKEEAKGLFEKEIELNNETIRLNRNYSLWGAKFFNAEVYAIIGEKEKAYQLLHEIENEIFLGFMVWEMQVNPMFESLREDEEFKQIIQRQEKKFADIRAEVDKLEEEGVL
ncbi:adenylate/guanylate cyclase domain-containing protein [Bacteroidota bacterium]